MRSRVNQKDPRNNNRDGTTQQTRAHSRGMPSSLICRVMSRILKAACYKLINTVLRAPLFLLALHHVLVHFLCIVLSVERLWRQDFWQINGDPSKSNLKSAIMIFYSLALAQGIQYLIWYILNFAGRALVNLVAKECEFDSKWGVNYVHKYLMVTEFKYLKDLSSNQGWDLITHAKDLLDSESEEDFLCGARMLATFIEKGELPVQELRLSRRKIQRLLMVLARTDPDDWEMRVLAAKILGHIARDICLSEFPGMSQCISSLLNPFEPCTLLCLAVPRPGNKKAEGNKSYRMECQLIQQGLVILESLANGEQNCMAICRAEGLVRSITALMFSTLLIHDKNVEWVDIQRGVFSVVARIISLPGQTTAEICQEIANKFEASMILRSANCPEIQILGINILTQTFMLVMDTGKRDAFLEVILRLFLSCQDDRNGRTTDREVQVKAGEALATLLMASENCCLAILGIQHDIVTVVDEILHSETSIVYRIIAAEILQHLCFHRALPCTEEMLSEVIKSNTSAGTQCFIRVYSTPIHYS